MKSLYVDFKKIFQDNDNYNEIFNHLKKMDETFFIKMILSDIYADIKFHSEFKKFIISHKEFLDFNLFNLFNILFCISPKEINKSFDYFFEIKATSRLIRALLSGNIRNQHNVVKEYCINNSIDKEYILVFYQFFLSRGYKINEIISFLGLCDEYKEERKKNIKVALLISGQMRGFESALQSWTKSFNLLNVELDVYVSTWKKTGRPSKLDWNRIGSSENINKIKKKYEDYSNEEILESLEQFLPPEILDEKYLEDLIKKYLNPNYIQIDIEDEKDFLSYSNPMKLYYKIHRCFSLSKEKKVYDLYFRIRPDIITSNADIDLYKMYNELALFNKIFCHYSYVLDFYGFGVDDKIAISKYTNMETYSNTWIRDHQSKDKMAGHINLATNLFFNRVDVDGIPGLQIRFANYNVL